MYNLLLTDGGKLECYKKVIQMEDSKEWKHIMDDEMQSLMLNKTWDLAKIPDGNKALHNKWVYKLKEEPNDSKRYKVRLVLNGF